MKPTQWFMETTPSEASLGRARAVLVYLRKLKTRTNNTIRKFWTDGEAEYEFILTNGYERVRILGQVIETIAYYMVSDGVQLTGPNRFRETDNFLQKVYGVVYVKTALNDEFDPDAPLSYPYKINVKLKELFVGSEADSCFCDFILMPGNPDDVDEWRKSQHLEVIFRGLNPTRGYALKRYTNVTVSDFSATSLGDKTRFAKTDLYYNHARWAEGMTVKLQGLGETAWELVNNKTFKIENPEDIIDDYFTIGFDSSTYGSFPTSGEIVFQNVPEENPAFNALLQSTINYASSQYVYPKWLTSADAYTTLIPLACIFNERQSNIVTHTYSKTGSQYIHLVTNPYDPFMDYEFARFRIGPQTDSQTRISITYPPSSSVASSATFNYKSDSAITIVNIGATNNHFYYPVLYKIYSTDVTQTVDYTVNPPDVSTTVNNYELSTKVGVYQVKDFVGVDSTTQTTELPVESKEITPQYTIAQTVLGTPSATNEINCYYFEEWGVNEETSMREMQRYVFFAQEFFTDTDTFTTIGRYNINKSEIEYFEEAPSLSSAVVLDEDQEYPYRFYGLFAPTSTRAILYSRNLSTENGLSRYMYPIITVFDRQEGGTWLKQTDYIDGFLDVNRNTFLGVQVNAAQKLADELEKEELSGD